MQLIAKNNRNFNNFAVFAHFHLLNNKRSAMDSSNNSSMEVDEERADSSGANGDNAEASEPIHWRCQPIESVHRGLQPYELEHLAAVHPTPLHRVLYRHPIREAMDEPPLPFRATARWDSEHVRLPCALESKYPVEAEDGSTNIDSRWGMIERALLRPITTSKQLQEAILSYNSTYKAHWSFRALHQLLNEEVDESEAKVFFEDLLPRIIRLALRLPELVQAPIPLLKQNQTVLLTLSQQQISCLLANAFLCTYPRRNTLKRKSEYSNFPDINFNRLYQSTGAAVYEKLKCLLHYFRRVCPTERDASNVPNGVVTFVRRSAKPESNPQWDLSAAQLAGIPVHVNAAGTIEDQGVGLLQMDFANKFIGGGVLGHGCVQEEIRFVICPELMVSKLFTECLLPSEALWILGAERYSNYTGYASSFTWGGNHEDLTPRDSSRRRQTAIVAIDALSFQQASMQSQYREDLILRELNKASIGFKHWLTTPPPGVATGNWGCGAFGGDAHLKALIQLMVCAHHNRPLAYFTFGNLQLRDDLHTLWLMFREQRTTVQQLWALLRSYKLQPKQTLYQFVLQEIKQQSQAAATTVKCVAAAQQEQKQEQEEKAAVVAMLAATLESVDSSNSSSNQSATVAATAEAIVAAAAAAAAEVVAAEAVAAAIDATVATKSRKAAGPSTSRQLTLLEMLDQHYVEGQANGGQAKRQHLSTSASCSSIKTRKDCEDDAPGTSKGSKTPQE